MLWFEVIRNFSRYRDRRCKKEKKLYLNFGFDPATERRVAPKLHLSEWLGGYQNLKVILTPAGEQVRLSQGHQPELE